MRDLLEISSGQMKILLKFILSRALEKKGSEVEFSKFFVLSALIKKNFNGNNIFVEVDLVAT